MKFYQSVAGVLGVLLASPAWAEIPDNLEPDYSEAVLAYNAKDYAKTLKIIEELRKKSPATTEFLELKALALKTGADKNATGETYEELIRVKTAEGRPGKELAPYHFELGVIRYGEKKFDEAKTHLLYAREYDFNEGPTNLYLGMFAFQQGAWGDADEYFHDVISSRADELKPASYFYMGQSQAKTDYYAGAIQNLIKARSSAKSMMNDSEASSQAKAIAAQIHGAADKALVPFDRSTFFASVGVMTGYDTNPLSVPSGSTQAVGHASAKETLFGGLGYATSPLGLFQFIPSARVAANMNLNEDAAGAEFFSTTGSLLVTRTPLERLSYGAKLEAAVNFRNQSIDGRFDFHPFTFSLSFGPNVRYELMRKVMIGAEFTWDPQNYLNDAEGEFARSAKGSNTQRIFVQNEAGRRFLNPMVSLRHSSNDAKGNFFRNQVFAGEVINSMHLTSTMDLVASAEYSTWKYKSRSPYRSDTMIQIEATLTRKFSKNWTGLATVDMTSNASGPDASDDSSFSYDRMGVNLGASYTF